MRYILQGWRLVVGAGAAAAMTLLSASGANAVTTTSALWHFNETSGNVAFDSSGNNLNGTFGSGVQVGQQGYSGTGYKFSTGHVTVPSAAKLNPGSRSFHFSMRVKTSTAPGAGVDYDLIRKGLAATAGGDYKMELLPSGGKTVAFCEFRGSRGVGSITSSTSTANLADGHWHKVTCTKKSGSISVTVDGTAKSRSLTIGSISNSAVLTIGAKDDGGDQYKGLMDEVALFLD